MAFLDDYALLLAIGLPVAVVAVANVVLALTGERDTLLLPPPGSFGPGAEAPSAAQTAPKPGARSAISAFRRFRLARGARRP